MGVVVQLGEARDPNAGLKPLLGLVAEDIECALAHAGHGGGDVCGVSVRVHGGADCRQSARGLTSLCVPARYQGDSHRSSHSHTDAVNAKHTVVSTMVAVVCACKVS